MTRGQPKAAVRCAIYPRKSTEDGLEQDFNSLDAQSEACAAFVLSQRAEGWQRLPDRYDDGGFSGGSTERPALQGLLADVAAHRIDVVVAYKVDRLTRSLTDFARIIGLAVAPEIAVGDGALGFWKALDEVFPGARHQRCWVHKAAKVLNKFPKSMAPTVKSDLRDIWQAETRAAAEAAMDTFAEKYGTKYHKAVACLVKDRDALLTFFDSPAEHWDHLRTANPIESVFATVRHRTVRTKGALS